MNDQQQPSAVACALMFQHFIRMEMELRDTYGLTLPQRGTLIAELRALRKRTLEMMGDPLGLADEHPAPNSDHMRGALFDREARCAQGAGS